MALQNLFGPAFLPGFIPSVGAPAFNSAMLMDAATEKVAFILEAPKTGNISRVRYRIRDMTVSTTVDVRLESVDTSAMPCVPSGTLLATNTNGSDSALVADSTRNILLTAAAPVTEGQPIAVVFANSGSGNFRISTINFNNNYFPFSTLFTASWAPRELAPVLALEYDDGAYYPIPGCYPYSSMQNVTYNSGSSPNERGMKFRVPVPCRLTGFWFLGTLAANGVYSSTLYDGSSNVLLQRASIPNNLRGVGSGSTTTQIHRFETNYDLAANTDYILAFKSENANNSSLWEFDVAQAAILDALELGQAAHYAHRTGAGAWTYTLTKRPFMGLMISRFDDGASGGGGSVIPINRPIYVPMY